MIVLGESVGNIFNFSLELFSFSAIYQQCIYLGFYFFSNACLVEISNFAKNLDFFLHFLNFMHQFDIKLKLWSVSMKHNPF